MRFVDRFIDWAHQCLLESDQAKEYLLGRGVSENQWTKHRLGYTGGEFDVDPSEDPSHSPVCLDKETRHLQCDVCHYRIWSSTWEGEEGTYKTQMVGRRIADSIVLPLTSYANQTVGFQVRSLAKKDYDTFVLRRRPEGYFFGMSGALEAIWSTREAWMVEGPFDQLVMERLVSPNVLSITTNQLGLSHIRFLRRFVDTVNLCFDLDKAGRDGVRSFLDKYSSEFKIVRNVKYPKLQEGDKDTGDFWKRSGDTAFSRYFRQTASAL